MSHRITITFPAIVDASRNKERISGSVATIHDRVKQIGRYLIVTTDEPAAFIYAFLVDGFTETLTVEVSS